MASSVAVKSATAAAAAAARERGVPVVPPRGDAYESGGRDAGVFALPGVRRPGCAELGREERPPLWREGEGEGEGKGECE